MYEKVLKLEKINLKMAKLKLEKEQLEAELIKDIGHKKEGASTYAVLDKNVTVTTNMIYSVDKSFYERDGVVDVLGAFNPVQTKVSYMVNKKIYKDALELASNDTRITLTELIDIKPAKSSVKISARV